MWALVVVIKVVVVLVAVAQSDTAADRARAAAKRLTEKMASSRAAAIERTPVAQPHLEDERQQPVAAQQPNLATGPSSEKGSSALATSAGVYRRLERANASALLELLEAVPLRVFELASDSVEGRRQLGVIGEDIESLIPEAVQVGRRVFAGSDGGLETVEKFAHVDQNVIFMHALAATQELATRQASMDLTIDAMSRELDASVAALENLRERASDEASAARREVAAIAAERERHVVLEAKVTAAREAAEKAINDHRGQLATSTIALEDELDKARIDLEDDAKRARQADDARLREATARREDELRGETEVELLRHRLANEQEIEALRRAAEIARVEAEARARAEADRANEDVRLRLLRARAAQDRKRVLEAISLAADYAARGATALLNDPRLLAALVGAVVALVAAGFFSRETAVMLRHLAEAYFGRPRLVRETSHKRLARARRWARNVARCARCLGRALVVDGACGLASLAARAAVVAARRVRLSPERRDELATSDRLKALARADTHRAVAAVAAAREAAAQRAFLDGVVLERDLRDRLVQLATSTRNAKRNRAPFRHALLYGPPGTGKRTSVFRAAAARHRKTLAAKRLAKASGLSYALMSGGDVGPLGADGVTALHSLFRWARASDDGVLVFIDEAEAFLASRANPRLTEHMRNALNAFLFQTGSPTSAFVIVLATNRPADLDPAVLDRVDETLYFGLPALDARQCLVPLYFDRYLGSLATRHSERWFAALVRLVTRATVRLAIAGDVDSNLLDDVAAATQGFSGREIEKLMVAIQSVAYGRNARLDSATLREVLDHKLEEHRRKADLAAARPDGFATRHPHVLTTPSKPPRSAHREAAEIVQDATVVAKRAPNPSPAGRPEVPRLLQPPFSATCKSQLSSNDHRAPVCIMTRRPSRPKTTSKMSTSESRPTSTANQQTSS
ncbi:hypothetical protein CTAYLR_000488 [Chrysophaeum taylorii]|uniref:AAA+ ATPase domain-containing protein n=1 Tax=Chrysophaeum taylorii TaxID=2483200 RepID=A0AAD7UGR3_9STRA|nr:hypothetical protein CTAYLR_000488 [Chrysophaeum taylorii]